MNSHSLVKNNTFFQVNRVLIETEIDPGVTVTFMGEVDLTEIEAWRKKLGDKRPTYTAFVAKAVAMAMQEMPYANRRVWKRWPWGTRMVQFHGSDVAVAAERHIPDAEGVAFIDILRDAHEASLQEMTSWLKALSQADETNNAQWRDFKKLTKLPRMLASFFAGLPVKVPGMWCRYRGGAVLISSPSKYGVDSVVATWPWPLGLSFGLVKDRAVVRDGEVVAAPTMNLVMNFDRRIMAGAPAAKFFKRLVDLLEHPEALCESQPTAGGQATFNPKLSAVA